MRPRVVVVDHSFHQKTKSSDFFLDILGEAYETVRLWDEGWCQGPHVTAVQIEEAKPEFVLFWQSIAPFSELRRLDRPIVWVPMFDEVVYKPPTFWRRLRAFDVKIVSFCSALTHQVTASGFDVLDLKFFPKPREAEAASDSTEKNLLIWQRTNIGPKQAEILFAETKLDRVTVKLDPDPGFEKSSYRPATIGGATVQYIEGFLPVEDYRALVEDSNLFLAPRKYEGIGLAFLEAMARGSVIAALDRPTMNEYIIHGETGYLFPYRGQVPLDLSQFDAVRKKSWTSAQKFHHQWTVSKEKIVPFLTSPSTKRPRPLSKLSDQSAAILNQVLRVPIWVKNKHF